MSRPAEHQPYDQGEPQPAQYPPSQPYGQLTPPVSKHGNGLAITALVVASLALLLGLGGLVAPLGLLVMGAFPSGPAGPFGDPGMAGTAPQVVAGQAYPGSLLQDEVSRVVGGGGSGGPSFSCPATPAVIAHAVTVCREVANGSGSTAKVTFEDDLGHFTLVWN